MSGSAEIETYGRAAVTHAPASDAPNTIPRANAVRVGDRLLERLGS